MEDKEKKRMAEMGLLELLVKMECERAIDYWFSPSKRWQRLHGMPVKPRLILDPDPSLLRKYVRQYIRNPFSLPPTSHEFEDEE